MSIPRHAPSAGLLAVLLLLAAPIARAQLVLNEAGFAGSQLSGDFAKQIEIGVGPDTCLYYGSFEGLRRRCTAADTGTVCDPTLTFPVGIAFSTGGSFGNFIYVSDYAVGNIHRAAGCTPSSVFATMAGPGALAFPPSGSTYGDFLYTCVAFSSPIYRVNSTGTVTPWTALPTAYLRFGPGGTWGTGLYATDYSNASSGAIDRVSSAGVITPVVAGFLSPEGFDWAFDGDLFAADAGAGQILRIKPNGTKSLFATLSGAADVAYRPNEAALYVVSNEGGLYRIRRSSTAGVAVDAATPARLIVAPNPAPGACALRFVMLAGGLARASVIDTQGRVVRRLPEAWRPAGAQSLAWDGRDERGVPVHAGEYFLRILAGGETRGARVTIVR